MEPGYPGLARFAEIPCSQCFLVNFHLSFISESWASLGTRDLALQDRDLGYPGWFFLI